MTPGEYRLRVRYGKTGRLRHLSHLEVVHALERSLRRANLPYAVTQGFNPHMKVAFGPALPVGTAGQNEYLDVWLTRYTSADDVLDTLVRSSPEDLAPREARFVGNDLASLTAALTIGMYRVEIDGKGIEDSQVQAALSQVMEEREFSIERKGKTKVYDLVRSIPKEPRTVGREGGVDIDLAIRMGPDGALRPEALVRFALSRVGIEPTALRTTRTDTLVESDEAVWSRPM
ncbi:MAG: TIGR03936 family radical SAM-associated protein [Coriobacteriia bacterium]|nr:TIGR03936 family radical SAM-associated protein [Coriobacteriia bacterium]